MDRGGAVANKWLLISAEHYFLIEFQSRIMRRSIFSHSLKPLLLVNDGYFLLMFSTNVQSCDDALDTESIQETLHIHKAS